MNTTVIHHSADYDGIFCREIARKFLPAATLIGWDFADPPLDSALLRDLQLVILDLPVDRVFGLQFKGGWVCRGEEQLQPIDRWESSNITWIDHHRSAIDSHPPAIPGYRIDGVAACRLAWQWFNRMGDVNGVLSFPQKKHFVDRIVTEPIAVRLAGEYDIWDKRDPRAGVFQFGLHADDLQSGDWEQLLSADDAHALRLLEAGRIAQRYQQHVDRSLMDSRGFDLTWEGVRFLCVNTGRFNSLTFESAVDPEKHDALLGFAWNGKLWTVSLYHAEHNKGIDLSVIATKYGGGGHRGACGFVCDKLPFIFN